MRKYVITHSHVTEMTIVIHLTQMIHTCTQLDLLKTLGIPRGIFDRWIGDLQRTSGVPRKTLDALGKDTSSNLMMKTPGAFGRIPGTLGRAPGTLGRTPGTLRRRTLGTLGRRIGGVPLRITGDHLRRTGGGRWRETFGGYLRRIGKDHIGKT